MKPLLSSLTLLKFYAAVTLLAADHAIAQSVSWRYWVSNNTVRAGPPPPSYLPFVATNDLIFGCVRGHATLRTEKTAFTPGELASLRFRFSNLGESHSFYNPFVSRSIPPSAKLAVYDSDKRCLGDIFFSLRAVTAPAPFHWAYIPQGCDVGATFDLRLTEMPPGDYYMQLIFEKKFLAADSAGLMRPDANDELFRSNPVKITIKSDDANTPAGPTKSRPDPHDDTKRSH